MMKLSYFMVNRLFYIINNINSSNKATLQYTEPLYSHFKKFPDSFPPLECREKNKKILILKMKLHRISQV